MSTTMKMSVIDEILNELEGTEQVEPEPTEPKASAEVKSEVPDLEPCSGTDEEGREYDDVKFSDLFWEPKTVPDHLVRVYKNLDDVPPMPGNYVPPVEEIELASLSFATGQKLLNVGPTGAGKTLMFEYMAHMMGRPYLRIEHNVFFSYEAVFGQTHINTTEDGTETDFVEGVFPKSMTSPTLVVLDETSRNTGHANILYQRALDRREFSLNEAKCGKGVRVAHPDWIICGTDNTKGNGDDMDKYSASNVQDQAFINRWDVIIETDYLTQEDEVTMIKRLAPKMDEDVAKSLAKFSGLMHAGFKSGEITTAFSPRNLVAICGFYNAGLTLRKAVEINYMSRCTKSELSDVNESFRTVFG